MPSFISYAQNLEDVMLFRALRHIESGFYIDLGAASPESDSVTKTFYDRGWSGVNVEPQEDLFKLLSQERPRDKNLNVGVGQENPEAKLFIMEHSGLSTFSETTKKQLTAQDARVLSTTSVPMKTLEQIWSENVPNEQPVHFLKMDIEGHEYEVISQHDWQKQRPWILVIEAIAPVVATEEHLHKHGPSLIEECHGSWEPILVAAGYIFIYADGVNRFYLASEQSELAEHFRFPPSIFDCFVRSQHRSEIASLQSEIASIRGKLEAAFLESSEALKREQALELQLEMRESKISAQARDLALVKDTLATKEEEITGIRMSYSWRATALARKLMSLITR